MKPPTLPPRKVLKALYKIGFVERNQTGSHLTLIHHKKSLRVTVPIHNRDIPQGTLRAIIKQAGMTVEEFLKLL